MDKVLDKRNDLIFEGTPKEIKEWLVRNPAYWMGSTTRECVIRIGDTSTIVSAHEYLGNGFHFEIKIEGRSTVDLSQFTPKYYEMDPETEDIIPDGEGLENGMVVLLENENLRVDLSTADRSEQKYYMARERNRWCKISDLRISGDMVRFTATYVDDTKRHRSYSLTEPWLVALDSIS